MKLNRRTTLMAALLTTTAVSIAWAVQPAHEAHTSAQPAAKGQQTLPECCAAMKKMGDEAMMKQKESDTRLGALLASMNEASGSGKVDAMASVINELVKQRVEGREHMMHMDAAMKEHMMQHMMAAAPADMCEKMKKGMEGCSMMHGPAGAGY